MMPSKRGQGVDMESAPWSLLFLVLHMQIWCAVKWGAERILRRQGAGSQVWGLESSAASEAFRVTR